MTGVWLLSAEETLTEEMRWVCLLSVDTAMCEFFANDDLVAVYGINDTEEGVPDYPNGWGSVVRGV